MQSLYKVIKNCEVVDQGVADIETEYDISANNEKDAINEVNSKEFIKDYESLARTMLQNARKQKDAIISKAFKEAEDISKNAYDNAYTKGYEEGKQKGYDTSYEEGYKKNIKKAEQEKEEMIENVREELNKMLYQGREEYLNYLHDKKSEIKTVIETMVESVFKREIKDEDSLNSMIQDVLKDVKNSKTVIVRCNSLYVENIKQTIASFKQSSVFKGEIFVIADEFLKEGVASIEKDNGKVIVDSKEALKKIKQIIEDGE